MSRTDVLIHPPSVNVAASVVMGSTTIGAAFVSASSGGTITHGDQLTPSSVGPWNLQGVSKGSETLGTQTGPSRGFWRFDAPDEFLPTGAWPTNANDSNPSILNDPTLHGGVVTGSPVTIDGYSIPVGTRIVQFRTFPDGYDFYAQGTSLKVLFRGCRFRWSTGVSGSGIFNDNTATSTQQIMMHYCDIGLLSLDPPNSGEGLMHIKLLGGANHRFLRNYHTRSAAFYQPNTQGCEFTENYIDEYLFAYGEEGGSTLHLNGISSEGGLTSIKILRNHICAPSPDGATGSTGSASGQIGYGTQPGQTGYGSGTNPGRLITQTDTIALFSTNGLPNQGDLQIKDNYLGGLLVYAGNALGNATGVVMTGNKFTTKWWTNISQNGIVTDQPTWGSNGNVKSGNVYADDYGSGGNGSTALADRQYPLGNGPLAGTAVI